MTAFQKQLVSEVEMNFYPCNRHLLVEGVESEKGEKEDLGPLVLVPDTYKVQVEEYGAYVILGVSDDCSIDPCVGDIVLVDNSMVKQIKFKEEIYTIVLENYVFGYIEDEESEDKELEHAWEK